MAIYLSPFRQVAVRRLSAAEVVLDAYLDAATAAGAGRLGRMAMLAKAAAELGTRLAFGSRTLLVWSVRVLDDDGNVLATSHVVLTCVRPVSATDVVAPQLN